MDSKYKAQDKYTAANCKQYILKVNKKTERDILERLRNCERVQTYIKQLIRADIAECNATNNNTILGLDKNDLAANNVADQQ